MLGIVIPAVPSSATADFSSNLSSGGALQFKEQETSQIPEGNGPATIAKNEERFTGDNYILFNFFPFVLFQFYWI